MLPGDEMPPEVQESKEAKKKRAREIVRGLKKRYPHARTALEFRTPFELLVATVLSAQSTDKKVNEVTKKLFEKYKGPEDFARARQSSLETAIRPTGFFRNKSKSLRSLSREIVEKYGGKVPRRLEDLVTLTGVGRKTANVVLAGAFGIPGIVVDTHMIRLARRLDLSREKDPVKIEFDLMKILPRKIWGGFSFMIVLHGRETCKARAPLCSICVIEKPCPSSTLKGGMP
jgi:endonuclease-3